MSMKTEAHVEVRSVSDEEAGRVRDRARTLQDAHALRKARRDRNITQVQLAERMGVTQNRISRMENGDPAAMILDDIRCYVRTLGGNVWLVIDFPQSAET